VSLRIGRDPAAKPIVPACTTTLHSNIGRRPAHATKGCLLAHAKAATDLAEKHAPERRDLVNVLYNRVSSLSGIVDGAPGGAMGRSKFENALVKCERLADAALGARRSRVQHR
jgi:hypothetical protein